ncbi:cyclic peptide export ABC transporter [Limisalsivibrio acetivorans]|uniref:cyclic peptide export ABC transporter n=1 Tax=Limisalsivibrio acetivorans TaxID=1304888 RepID=UPI0003B58675|nr:cyclic peptide export ABC transporter [Limisalsivibrio acetivorans]
MKDYFASKSVEFLQRESSGVDRKLVIMTALSGISNALLLAVVNKAISPDFLQKPDPKYFLYFALCIGMFIYSLRYLLYHSSEIIEEAVDKVRTRLVDKVLKCDLRTLETIGDSDIYTRISRETSSISQNMRSIFMAAQSSVMVMFTVLYIAFISIPAFLISMSMILFATYIYLRNRKTLEQNLYESSQEEDALFDTITDVLSGFKELKMNRAKSVDVRSHFRKRSGGVRRTRANVMLEFANNYVFAETFFYVLIGTIVFIMPAVSNEFGDTVVKVVTAILFLIGPLTNTVMQIPILSEVQLSVNNIYGLEDKIDTLVKGEDIDSDDKIENAENFDKIKLKELIFSYKDPDGAPSFTAGPFDFEINRGEVLFIVGGNGSGKTTLMKLMTALYFPDEGEILLDDTKVTRQNSQSYRELFSVIFAEFHLFSKLYGMQQVNPEKVKELLELMEIDHKTDFKDSGFTNLNLSTGQRKRLALIVTYLEDKEIYVFDEWAADQDPHFRRYFYYTLVPELKKRGKTVIAVSHDDRYFSEADRVLSMDFGQVTEISNGRSEG